MVVEVVRTSSCGRFQLPSSGFERSGRDRIDRQQHVEPEVVVVEVVRTSSCGRFASHQADWE